MQDKTRQGKAPVLSSSYTFPLLSFFSFLLFFAPQDNPALISLTLAESKADSERDKNLGPTDLKRAAAVRSYCKKIEVMTRPELKKEVEKYKKRREQVPCLALSCLALPCLVLFCLVLFCLVLFCLVLSCLVLPCLALPCLILHCLELSCISSP